MYHTQTCFLCLPCFFLCNLIGNKKNNKSNTSEPARGTSTVLEPQLEIPCQERLLPIGQHNKDISQFVDKVKQALGLNIHQNENQKLEIGKSISDQVKKEDRQHQSSPHSPRKLIKQVALESPPPNQIGENGNSMILFKSLKMDNQSKM